MASRSKPLNPALFRRRLVPACLASVLMASGCESTTLPKTSAQSPGITTISIGPGTLHAGVERFGINLSGQNFYDSGQLLRNYAYRNPGFEGETWQSILHCKTVSENTCTDENPYTVWPAGFMAGARYEILSGSNRGATGAVQASSAVAPPRGVTLTLETHPAQDAFILVRIDRPGGAEAGWWTEPKNGASLSTELLDLPPGTTGKQALRIQAAGANQTATVKAFFDTFNNRSFVQMRGRYTVSFRAKGLTPGAAVQVNVVRLATAQGNHSFLARRVPLTSAWHDYSFDFSAAEDGTAVGPAQLAFEFAAASALLDDAAITEAASPDNPTVFRNAVVQTLRDLHPGVLRYMDSGANFGSSIDNLLAPQFARQRTGSSTQLTLQEDAPIGLHDFLVLCKAVGADPWFAMPPGMKSAEAANLVEYFSGPASSPYGAIRARLGQAQPWTQVFRKVHLELGNEQWNARSFAGSTIQEPRAYGARVNEIFTAARSSKFYDTARFDLVLGSWATVPWWTENELATSGKPDSVALAPYLFNEFNDTTSAEAVFGPMFAQPEMIDSRPAGYMAQQAMTVRAASPATKLAIYEVNLSTVSGAANQHDIDQTVPSVGAGLAVADHMLLMLRDLGITTQCLFALPEYVNGFQSTTAKNVNVPLWGSVVDMGGPTDLRRPQFLFTRLINSALLPTMLETHMAGPAHTWNQPLSTNDKIKLEGAHLLQTFAFADGPRRSLILLNLSRSETIPVKLAGAGAPSGLVDETRLTSATINDSNEFQAKVLPIHRELSHFPAENAYLLPPFSMTVLAWKQ